MKILLTQDLPFIHKKGIREAYLENQRGEIWVLKCGEYKQLLKTREYEAVLKASNVAVEESVERVAVAEPKKVKKLALSEGSLVSWVGKKGTSTGEVLELIENGKKARVQSDLDGKVYKVPAADLILLEA